MDLIDRQSDTISRQLAIEAVRVMQTYKLSEGDDMLLVDQAEVMTELMIMPSAEPELATNLQQSCNQLATDTISRQAAIDALKEHEDDKGYLRGDFEEILEALPSAEPRKGEWIDDGQYGDNFPHHAWLCSECGEGVIEIDTPWFKFCPNCGARMTEGEVND